MKKIMVIAAHPDDEILGCGGTCYMHCQNGDIVQPVLVCEGESMRGQDSAFKTTASKEAAKVLGMLEPIFLKLPDQKLDTLSLVDVIQPIEKLVSKFKPNIVYTHHRGDLNKDHRLVFEAAIGSRGN